MTRAKASRSKTKRFRIAAVPWPRRRTAVSQDVFWSAIAAASERKKPVHKPKPIVPQSLGQAFASLALLTKQLGVWEMGAPPPNTKHPSWIEVEEGFVRIHQRGDRDRVKASAEILAVCLQAMGLAASLRDITHCVNMRGYRASFQIAPAARVGFAR